MEFTTAFKIKHFNPLDSHQPYEQSLKKGFYQYPLGLLAQPLQYECLYRSPGVAPLHCTMVIWDNIDTLIVV